MNEERRSYYISLMAQNLPTLRSKLNVTQAELADRVGVTRHTLLAAERNKRSMTWMMFVALLTVFLRNTGTKALMKTLGIYDDDLDTYFTFKPE